MATMIGKVGTTTHVFTSEKEFIPFEVWILQRKGKELFDEWQERELDATEESRKHPDSVSFYEEWLEDQGVTHTQTKEE